MGTATVSPLEYLGWNKRALCVQYILERDMWLKSKSFISCVCVCVCVCVCDCVCVVVSEREILNWVKYLSSLVLSHLTNHLIHRSLHYM